MRKAGLTPAHRGSPRDSQEGRWGGPKWQLCANQVPQLMGMEEPPQISRGAWLHGQGRCCKDWLGLLDANAKVFPLRVQDFRSSHLNTFSRASQ